MPSKMNCHFLAMRVEHPASHYLLRLIAPRAHPRLNVSGMKGNCFMSCADSLLVTPCALQ